MPRSSRHFDWQQLLRSRITYVVGAGIMAFLLVSFGRELMHRYEVNQEIRALEAQMNDLQAKRAKLTDLIEYFSSPLFQEQEARQKLGKAKPGESVVIVPLSDAANTETSSVPGTVPSPSADAPNPLKWWRYFFPS